MTDSIRPLILTASPAFQPFAAVLPHPAPLSAVEAAVNAQVADETGLAAKIGFFLALTVPSHGLRGDRAWLAEAVRLAGEDATVGVRPEEG